MEFSRQEYCSGLPFSSPGDLPNPGLPALQAKFFPLEPPGNPLCGVLERYKDANQESEPQKGYSQPLSQSVVQ